MSEANSPFPAGADPDTGVEQFRELHQRYRDFLESRMQTLFNRADDTLFNLAEKAENNQQQNLYFDTMRALRLERQSILDRFDAELSRRMLDPSAPGAASGAPARLDDDFGLSLVEDRDLEESVAITNMVMRAESAYRMELTQLKTRLEWVREHAVDRDRIVLEAFHPQPVCRSLQHALEGLDQDISIKLIVYKLLDMQVLSQLGEFYGFANRLLASAGVLPRIGAAPRATARGAGMVSGSGMPGAEGAEAAGAEAGWGGADGAAGSGYASAMPPTAMAGMPGMAGMGMPMGPPALLDRPTLISALTRLQMQPWSSVRRPEDVNAGQMLEGLLERISGTATAGALAIPTRERRMIELVSMMLADILSDRNVTEPAKDLIAQLEAPIVKAALIDPNFFRDQQHPARQLVHQIAQVGTTLYDTDSAMYRRLRGLVEHVQKRFDTDVNVFGNTLNVVKDLSSKEEGRFLEDERNRSKSRREQLLRKARDTVLELLRERMGDRVLPPRIRAFIMQGWGPLLVVQYINHGREATPFQTAERLLDELIRGFSQSAEDQASWFESGEAEVLRVSLQGQLDAVNFDPEKAELLLAGLEHEFRGLRERLEQQGAFVQAESAAPTPPQAETVSAAAAEPPAFVLPDSAVEVVIESPERVDATDAEAPPAAEVSPPQTAEAPAEVPAEHTPPVPPTPLPPMTAPVRVSVRGHEESRAEQTNDPDAHSSSDASASAPAAPPVPIVPPAPPEEAPFIAPAADEGPAAAVLDGFVSAEVDAFLHQFFSAEVWFQIWNGEGRAVRRLKSSSYDRDQGLVMFSDRSGRPALFRNASEFMDDLLGNRSACVFEDEPFNRALEHYRQHFRHQSHAGGGPA